MAEKKTSTTKKSTTSSTKKNTTKKTTKTTTAKKTTSTKTAVKKAPAKKVEAKKVEVKPAEVKTVETKKVVKKEKFDCKKWLQENYMIVCTVVIALLLIINIVIVTVGHKVQLQNGKEVIAELDGKKFTAEELFDELKAKYGTDSLLSMVDEYVVSKEIKDKDKVEAKKTAKTQIDSIRSQYESANYKWEDVLKQYGYASEEALIDEMTLSVEKEMVAKNYLASQITEEEIKKYYDENTYGTYTVKHILITASSEDAEEAAKAKANEVIEKLKNGAEWKDLVNEYSEDTASKENEGLIENFTKGDMVDEFFNATVALKDGEYTTEPVKSTYGYHVILRVSSKDKKALKDMKDELVEKMVEEKLNSDTTLYTSTWANLRKKYNLSLKDSTIKNKYNDATNKSE